MQIQVSSEIGKLKKVLLHRPGLEVERQYPAIFKHTLFDDIMYVEQAQKDHDFFAHKLKEHGVEVLYIEKLVAEIFDKDPKIRIMFLKQFIRESGVNNHVVYQAVYDFFNQERDNLQFVRKLIAGVLKSEINPLWDGSIESHVLQANPYPFYIDPLPNLLFQRDPIASIFNGINIHNMTKSIRKREGIFYEYLLSYHPEWLTVTKHLMKNHKGHMEGGDVLVMNQQVIFVGVSERTTAKAIEQLALILFKKYQHLENIIGIQIPSSHTTMHLDTMFTQIDYDKFSVDIDMAKNKYLIYILSHRDGKLEIKTKKTNIKLLLQEYVHPNPQLLIVGNNEIVAGRAEQWNDGANCLALEPGVIVVYDRNVYTNQYLEKMGVQLIKIPSGELSRGRGGPHCMTMALEREPITALK